jgi:FMN-dependent NADH-azoreductase
MKKLLYVNANPKPVNASESRKVAEAFLDSLNTDDFEITTLNLYEMDVPLIDADVLSGWGKLQSGKDFSDLDPQEQENIGVVNTFTEQFMNHDFYVFSTPLWNFSIPPQLKAYIDTFVIAGKTFKYTENGPVGLLQGLGKKAVVIQASGGFYENTDYSGLDHGANYLRDVLSFLGIEEVNTIKMEGINFAPEKIESFRETAMKQAQSLAQAL